MPDMFQDSANWLSRASAWGSQLVSYVRDEEVLATFKATPTLEEWIVIDGAGNQSTISGYEFAVNTDDFEDSNGDPISVQRDDEIHMGTRVFVVMPPAPRDQPRPIDPHGVRIAIKTRETT